MTCKHFLIFCGLSFHSLDTQVFNFNEVEFTYFSFCCLFMVSYLKIIARPARWLRLLELRAPNAEGCRFDFHMGQWAVNHKVAGSIPRLLQGMVGCAPCQLTTATGPGAELRPPQLRLKGQLDLEKVLEVHTVPK
ncbi:hypothetical protein mRhiFer1_009721 [Rhinolophus ferrumequinum]|uniref:Uncharacterized protein n=1 Tax=Rhinolophus ferrumequinum TaxID=59479 RepID=A0A7J7ZE66_RHIFE|nr:hypothetical protein mRhiFer1_009721 [Rhinolophus ferrumequinum]